MNKKMSVLYSTTCDDIPFRTCVILTVENSQFERKKQYY